MKYFPIIGLEVHVELKTKSKMFCSCAADWFGAKPNTLTCPVCLGLPGALPVANRHALEMTARLGLALHGKVEPTSYFERKNYFYPDLPKGYQISQYRAPLCRGGYLEVAGRKIRINRVHQEEDTAKLVHGTDSKTGDRYTLVDFNRSGVPLTEIVTEPDIHSAEEAKKYLRQLRRLIRYLDISDADMDKGSMRLEANVSLKKVEGQSVGQNTKVKNTLPDYRIEIKNVNSFRFVEKAINYEIKRQTEALERGEKLMQETRGWDEKKQETFLQRTKEAARDYRYFPEPDLPPMEFSEKWVSEIENELPELPEAKVSHFIKDYDLTPSQADLLVETQSLAEKFEATLEYTRGVLKLTKKRAARDVANHIVNLPADEREALDPKKFSVKIYNEKTQKMLGDAELLILAREVVAENEKASVDYRKGKMNALQFLVGCLYRKAPVGLDAQKAGQSLKEVLEGSG